MATKQAHQKLLDLAGQFIIENNDGWDHFAWEELLRKAADLGFDFHPDESRRQMGNILEAARFFRGCAPAPASKKRPVRRAVKKTGAPAARKASRAGRTQV